MERGQLSRSEHELGCITRLGHDMSVEAVFLRCSDGISCGMGGGQPWATSPMPLMKRRVIVTADGALPVMDLADLNRIKTDDYGASMAESGLPPGVPKSSSTAMPLAAMMLLATSQWRINTRLSL